MNNLKRKEEDLSLGIAEAMPTYQFMNKLKMIWDRRLEPTTQPPLAEPSSFVNIKPVIPTICHNIYNVKNQHTNKFIVEKQIAQRNRINQ